ncbi:MAG: hypothetical protein Q4G10_00045 [Bacteroidia bacterium]|nr:hypothetical protein [Bacteroidia bacterium]
MKRFLSYFLIVPLLCSCVKDFSEDIHGVNVYDDTFKGDPYVDPAFAKYCLEAFDGSADGIKDGILQEVEIRNVRTIDCSGLGIASLVGIEKFSSLDTLICRDNSLIVFDVTYLPSLKYLDCSGNAISELNVSCSDISTLFCCPMTDAAGRNVLGYLYIRRGQEIEYITSDRDKADPKRIPDETMIIAIPESKDGEGLD